VIAGGGASGASAAKSSLAVVAATGRDHQLAGGVRPGDLEPASSVTNATGEAATNVLAGNAPGAVVIRATRADDPSVTVDFHLTVTAAPPKLAELPGLNENQKAIADLLDRSARTTPERHGLGLDDLLGACDELIAAIGTDPSA
jgi:hypothetical protein